MLLVKSLLMGSLIICSALAPEKKGSPIMQYEQFYALCPQENREIPLVAIRQFRKNNREYCLLINPETVSTIIRPKSGLTLQEYSFETIREKVGKTPYARALAFAELTAKNIRNAGITRVPNRYRRVYLTIDLCPSHHPLDRNALTRIIRSIGTMRKPVPLALAISGRWITQHPKDLLWILQQEKRGYIAVTWINHTQNHGNDKKLPPWMSFLLKKNTDVESEVLGAEKQMLARGITPTVFFRFPGLMSNNRIFERVIRCGLIPIGSDAWLGKKQKPQYGSIILVHGTGNEPVGIRRLLVMLEAKGKQAPVRTWSFSPLGRGIQDLFTGQLTALAIKPKTIPRPLKAARTTR